MISPKKILYIAAIIVLANMGRIRGDEELKCPPEASIAPVSCDVDWNFPAYGPNEPIWVIRLYLNSSVKTQAQIDKTFRELRKANNLTEKEELTIDFTQFSDIKKSLATINLHYSPKVNFEHITFADSIPQLSKELVVKSLYVENVSLPTDKELEKAFEKVSKPTLKKLHLTLVGLTKVPSLINKYPNLKVLYLYANKIRKLGRGVFSKISPNLTDLHLGTAELEEICEDALLLPSAKNKDIILNIDLSYNSLNETTWSVKSGINQMYNVYMILWENKFDTMSEGRWKQFLLNHERNTLNMNKNPLICDKRMKWLKEGRERFKKQFLNGKCKNDPGKTVFTSELV